MIDKILSLVGQIASSIINFVLSVIFIWLPTITTNPSDTVTYIEKDLTIDIPEKYEVVDNYAEFFIFEENIELTLKFTEIDSNIILEQIKTTTPLNGKWVIDDDNYEFELNTDFTTSKRYYFEAAFNPSENILNYKYSSL